MNIEHPIGLLPTPLPLNVIATVRMPRSEFLTLLNRLIKEYFEQSDVARRLWYQHTEGLINDDGWVIGTVSAMREFVQAKLKEMAE